MLGMVGVVRADGIPASAAVVMRRLCPFSLLHRTALLSLLQERLK
jgi:hypothetical protein